MDQRTKKGMKNMRLCCICTLNLREMLNNCLEGSLNKLIEIFYIVKTIVVLTI